MNFNKKECFLADYEYNRYIIGSFENKEIVSSFLKDYSEICIDSPKINDYYNVGNWIIINCPSNLISRGCFFDLMNYLSQYSENIFAIGINESNSYFSIVDSLNPFGDTVIVKFDDGTLIKWDLPIGLTDDMAYSFIDNENIISQNNCKEFLISIKAYDLIKHFNL